MRCPQVGRMQVLWKVALLTSYCKGALQTPVPISRHKLTEEKYPPQAETFKLLLTTPWTTLLEVLCTPTLCEELC